MARATMRTNNTGIVTFVKPSMPFFTPARTMPATSSMKMVWTAMGPPVEEMNSPKKPCTCSGGVFVKSKQTALYRYSTDQPPTTE